MFFYIFSCFFVFFKCRVFVVVKTKTYKITNMMHFSWAKSAKVSISWTERVFCSSIKLIDFMQGRLSLSTDGDKCAMVNFGGNEKSILGGMKKFNIKSVDFVHKFNN